MSKTIGHTWKLSVLAFVAAAACSSMGAPAHAQRALGLDISAWQGNISQTTWNNLRNVENREFVFLRSSRGGTTGYYNQSNADNDPPTNTLSQRYDDPYFVQNINRATTAGMYAGSYHFSRPDIIAGTLNANGFANSGADEADHFLQMAGAWMRPGYMLPVHDLEAGISERSAADLIDFAVDFSDRIYNVMGIRPMVYTGGNYASYFQSASSAKEDELTAAHPVLWTARWPNQEDPDSIPVQTANPGDYTSTVYGPWDDAPNPAHPWHFWQYASTGRLESFNSGNSNLDFDVANGGVEYLRDHLVPAIWMNDNSGQWTTLANWNSGQTPIAPVTGPGQVAPVGTQSLPTPRLPGAAGSGVSSGQHDTVILDRPNANITVTLASGTHNIRKLYAREALNITGGSLTINYVPSADSTPLGAQYSAPVSLSGGSLSVHTLQVDAQQTFSLGGASLALNTISLMPHSTTPATMLFSGDMNLSPLANAAAVIANGSGAGATGRIDLGGATRVWNVANGAAANDLTVGVPILNGGLTKSGLGTLALNGTNSYTGNTAVQAGTLSVATPFLANTSDVMLTSGSTLNLGFSAGTPNLVNALYIDGIAQAAGTWGATGSGAQHTSPLITGTGRLNVGTYMPPPMGPGNVLDDFEVNEGHFNWNYNFSPGTQTYGLTSGPASSSGTSDRVTTEHQGAGVASQLLNLIATTPTTAWQLRHNSGIGSPGLPANNVALPSTGWIGFWLKTDDPGVQVQIALDDPSSADLGTLKNLIADNEWHLYQWNLDDDAQWDGWVNGDGSILGATVTIDSIFFKGLGSAQIYMDTVSHNPFGMLAAALIPGDYNADGLVDEADYTTWRGAFGTSVTPGSGADGNGDGQIDTADYIFWRSIMNAAAASAALLEEQGVPEPATLALFAMAASMLVAHRADRDRAGRLVGSRTLAHE